MMDIAWVIILTLVLALDVVMVGFHAKEGNVGWAIWFTLLVILLTVSLTNHVGGLT